jgi:hypothetical protein
MAPRLTDEECLAAVKAVKVAGSRSGAADLLKTTLSKVKHRIDVAIRRKLVTESEMRTPGTNLTDDLLRRAVALNAERGLRSASIEMDVSPSTFQYYLKRAAARGLSGTEPVMPGYEISRVSTSLDASGDKLREHIQQRPERGESFEMPDGHIAKGYSVLLDGDGRTIQQWVKTREGQIDPLEIAEQLKAAFDGYEPCATPKAKTGAAQSALLTLIPCNDWHVGCYIWGDEASENWDLGIAEARIGAAIDDLVARTPPSETAVVLGGGDLLHSDNNLNRTAASGNPLDVDGRYPRVLMTACRLCVRTVDQALDRHGNVIVRILPGNHDEHASVAIAYFLLAWYRNEPRVEVDADPSLFWWFRHGLTFLGATHGHTVKMKDMPQIMAHRRAEDWGASKFRYVHGFHLHHSSKLATEGGGVICEIHQAPVPMDAWHFGSGYLSGRSLQAITYHESYGEISRARVAIIDAESAA